MDWSALNVAWTTIALIGTLASSRVFWLSLGDYRIVRLNPRGATAAEYHAKLVIAEMALFGEFARFFVQAFFLSLGILAITTPPPSRLINNVIIGLFIASGILLMASSLKANIARNEVVKGENGNGTH